MKNHIYKKVFKRLLELVKTRFSTLVILMTLSKSAKHANMNLLNTPSICYYIIITVIAFREIYWTASWSCYRKFNYVKSLLYSKEI